MDDLFFPKEHAFVHEKYKRSGGNSMCFLLCVYYFSPFYLLHNIPSNSIRPKLVSIKRRGAKYQSKLQPVLNLQVDHISAF